MNTRLERTLVNLAQQHAQHLVTAGSFRPTDSQRIPTLARALAAYDLLVMMGYLPPALLTSADKHIQEWVDAYGQLYHLLAGRLFPSLIAINAEYIDDQLPVIIVIQGAATPVIQIFAGLITPYIATRQSFPVVSEAELLGLMDIVLEELEATDLPRKEYNLLKVDGARILARLLECKVRQVGVTLSDRAIFGKMTPFSLPPDQLPEQPAPRSAPRPETPPAPAHIPEAIVKDAAPAAPETVPAANNPVPQPPTTNEAGKPVIPAAIKPPLAEEDQTPSEVLFSPRVPLRPPPRKGTGASKRRLPVPDLPDKPDDSA